MRIEHAWAGGGLLVGLLGGFVAATLTMDKKLRVEYDKTLTNMRAAYEQSIQSVDDMHYLTRKISETDADKVLDPTKKAVDSFTPSQGGYKPENNNPYHKPVHEVEVETPVEPFTVHFTNEYGITYIEEDDFLEEDGRYKGQITFLMDYSEPAFWMDGVKMETDEASLRLGASFLDDFPKFARGENPSHLYLRNESRDEDYEVIGEHP